MTRISAFETSLDKLYAAIRAVEYDLINHQRKEKELLREKAELKERYNAQLSPEMRAMTTERAHTEPLRFLGGGKV